MYLYRQTPQWRGSPKEPGSPVLAHKQTPQKSKLIPKEKFVVMPLKKRKLQSASRTVNTATKNVFRKRKRGGNTPGAARKNANPRRNIIADVTTDAVSTATGVGVIKVRLTLTL
ncbi:MAG: putative transposase [Bacilladnavirus sp.]|nr:MAG: putative transposase [Bacilladnavirus sp.]